MKCRIRQRSPGTWQISYELGRDNLAKRKTKAVTFRATKADAQHKLREFLTALAKATAPNQPTSLCASGYRWMAEVIAPARRESTADR